MLKEMDLYTRVAVILVLIGGICWGIFGLFNVNLLTGILGGLARIIDIVIGVGAGWLCYKVYLEYFKKSI